MKRPALLFTLLLLGALAAFALCYRSAMRPINDLPPGVPAELAWLRAEFCIDDEAFAKVRALHEAYEPRCIENCAQIAAVNDRIRTLAAKAGASAAERDAALAEAANLQRKCRGEMWRHIDAVAVLLPVPQAQRYRAMMARALVNPGLPYPPTRNDLHGRRDR